MSDFSMMHVMQKISRYPGKKWAAGGKKAGKRRDTAAPQTPNCGARGANKARTRARKGREISGFELIR
jgi:hypothetical protein